MLMCLNKFDDTESQYNGMQIEQFGIPGTLVETEIGVALNFCNY
jgi:hypothetical protein